LTKRSEGSVHVKGRNIETDNVEAVLLPDGQEDGEHKQKNDPSNTSQHGLEESLDQFFIVVMSILVFCK
jgi:hypothetical protein